MKTGEWPSGESGKAGQGIRFDGRGIGSGLRVDEPKQSENSNGADQDV